MIFDSKKEEYLPEFCMAMEINMENFEQEVLKSDKPVLVDFFASWCGPCQMMLPIIDELAEELKDKVKIVKVSVEKNPDLASKYEVMSIPAFKVFKGGQIIKEFIGAQSKDILKDELSKL